MTKDQVLKALSQINYPGFNRDIVSFGLIEDISVGDENVRITLKLSAEKSKQEEMQKRVRDELESLGKFKNVEVVMTGSTQPMGNIAQSMKPEKVKHIIAVASGKGGVGKSTVSVNLALALSQKGYKVSIFDADIYGPSLPIMTGRRGEKPSLSGDQLMPIESFGVHTLSIGNLVDENNAVVWRGPMVHQAIEQLFRDTKWPGGDFMIIDLPPGTGDVQLSLSQLCEITGSVIVSTPQDVALIDAIKAAQMFKKVEIEVLGIVENMSFFACPKCGEETPIFSRHGAENTCSQLNTQFLGSIPIEIDVRKGGDEGKPLMSRNLDSAATASFKKIADNLVRVLEED